jgi:hypothetical protein
VLSSYQHKPETKPLKLKIPLPVYLVAYFVLMMLLYHFMVKHYFYWGYLSFLKDEPFGFSAGRGVLSLVLFLMNLASIMKIYRNRMNFLVLFIFFILTTIPSLIAYTSGPIYPAQLLVYHQVFFYLLLGLSLVKIDYSGIPVLNKKQSLLLLFLITTIGIIPYLMVYGPYIDLKNLFLLDVYKTRAATKGLSNLYFGYTYSLFTKIIIPLIIIFSLELKNKLMAMVGILYLVLFYLFGAHKTVYLGIAVVLAFYRFNYIKSANWLIFLSLVSLMICILLAVFGFDYLWILTFRRVHFLPTLLDISYLDFFKENFMCWSESIFSSLVEYPYERRHEYLIGEVYFNRSDMAANNGLVSDGYMNFGFVGVLAQSLIIGLYFMFLNSMRVSSKYFGIYFLVIFSFISSSLFTVFLTHGAIALLFISLFLLRDRNE